jgi:hypothetical protein
MIDLVKVGNVLSNQRYDKLSAEWVKNFIVVKFFGPLHTEIDMIQTDEAAALIKMGLYICHINESKQEIWLQEIKFAGKFKNSLPDRELKAITITPEDWKRIEKTL